MTNEVDNSEIKEGIKKLKQGKARKDQIDR